ncbi:hypothetical protein Dform_01894 [Dehalogenimonas formicexedens]|uniref:Uncharacterized protein n=1 Tax=Dehalogenimonas formicexedens TaxID=1839801 RepID=A0A1P8F9R1_9CHLR|nr:hypothetical protein Dform_01894 [Dehalogenimonas formicexedens]
MAANQTPKKPGAFSNFFVTALVVTAAVMVLVVIAVKVAAL